MVNKIWVSLTLQVSSEAQEVALQYFNNNLSNWVQYVNPFLEFYLLSPLLFSFLITFVSSLSSFFLSVSNCLLHRTFWSSMRPTSANKIGLLLRDASVKETGQETI